MSTTHPDIEQIIARVRERFPDVVVSQLEVVHPGADDDGLWYFGLQGIRKDIQIESSTGACPFILEHSGMKSTSEAWHADSVDEAVDKISAYLATLKGR